MPRSQLGGSSLALKEPTTPYRDQLRPWCVVRQTKTLQSQIVSRCRRRAEAEAQLRLLQQLHPEQTFTIVFEGLPPTPEEPPAPPRR